jgi:uncharacterized membrane protein YbhN (UPF0104 family)
VISERVFDFIILMLILLGVFIFQIDFLKDFTDKYFLSSLDGMASTRNILFAIIGLVVIIVLPLLLWRYFHEQIKEVPIFKKITSFLKGLVDGIRTIQRMKQKVAFIFWTLVIWTLYVMMTFVGFFALTETSHLNFMDGVTIMAIGSLGIVAPVPGGIGAYQFIVTAMLVEIYGIASEPAASFSIILWFTQTILIITLGIFSYYMLMFKKTKNKNDNA